MPLSQKCAVPYCFHRKKKNNCIFPTFPRDIHRCRKWLKMVGDEDLLHLSLEFLTKSRYVCGCHFVSSDFIKSNKRLTSQSVPSIFDSRVSPLSEDAVMQFPIKNPIKVQTEAIRMPLSDLMVSANINKSTDVIDSLPPSKSLLEIEPMSIDNSKNNHDMSIDTNASSEVSIKTTPKQKKLRLSVAVVRKSTKKVAETLGVPSTGHSLTEKMALREVRKLQGLVIKLSSKLESTTQERDSLAELCRDASKNLPLLIKSPILREVVAMNIKNQDRKPQGRRYSEDQKLISTQIEKLSTKCYRFLMENLDLPTSRTNKKVLKSF